MAVTKNATFITIGPGRGREPSSIVREHIGLGHEQAEQDDGDDADEREYPSTWVARDPVPVVAVSTALSLTNPPGAR
jgi:hypothetical protein